MKKFFLLATVLLTVAACSKDYEPDSSPTLRLGGLEWMTSNLTGFGGTEVGGNTYYTWWEAMKAAEELGDGWRLPTREEFEALCDLGSTWDDERKGRWFGGNHDTDHKGSLFLPAAGGRNNMTGDWAMVGYEGYYWSSSPYPTGGPLVNYLFFHSFEDPDLFYMDRSDVLSVRLVRRVEVSN